MQISYLGENGQDYLVLQPTSKDEEGTFCKGMRTIPYYRKLRIDSSIRNQMLVNAGFDLGVLK